MLIASGRTAAAAVTAANSEAKLWSCACTRRTAARGATAWIHSTSSEVSSAQSAFWPAVPSGAVALKSKHGRPAPGVPQTFGSPNRPLNVFTSATMRGSR